MRERGFKNCVFVVVVGIPGFKFSEMLMGFVTYVRLRLWVGCLGVFETHLRTERKTSSLVQCVMKKILINVFFFASVFCVNHSSLNENVCTVKYVLEFF